MLVYPVPFFKSATVPGTPIIFLDGANAGSSSWPNTGGGGYTVGLLNSPSKSTDNGGYVIFNGTNQYGKISGGNLDDWTNGITILAFVDFGSNTGTWERIVDLGVGQANENIVFSRNGTSNTLQFEIYNGASQIFAQGLSNGITNNGWGFYGARLDGSSWKILNATTSTSGSSTALPPNVSRPNSYIGRSNWTADAYFERYMGMLAIYNSALSDSDITSFFNLFRGRYGL